MTRSVPKLIGQPGPHDIDRLVACGSRSACCAGNVGNGEERVTELAEVVVQIFEAADPVRLPESVLYAGAQHPSEQVSWMGKGLIKKSTRRAWKELTCEIRLIEALPT
jgi:hypothetical protein